MAKELGRALGLGNPIDLLRLLWPARGSRTGRVAAVTGS